MSGVTASPRRPVTIGTVLLLLLALVWYAWPPADPVPPPRPPTVPAGGRDGAPAEGRPTQTEREFIAAVGPDDSLPEPGPAEEADLDHPFAFAVELHLVDAYALPVPEVSVFLAPTLCGFSLWPEVSDARGVIQVHWLGRQRNMAVQLAVMVYGVLQPIRQLDLTADETRRLTMVVQGKQQEEQALERVRGRSEGSLQDDIRQVQRERERGLRQGRLRRIDDLDVLCGRTQLLFERLTCENCHTRSQVGIYATLARSGVMSVGLHPFSRFQERQRDSGDKVARATAMGSPAPITAPAPPTQAEPQRSKPRQAFVVGTVKTSLGSSAALVPVAGLDDRGGLVARTTTSPSGGYRLGPMVPGPVTLVAGGGQDGDVRTSLVVLAGDENQWNCNLICTGVISGHAHDERGGVLTEWRVEFEGLKGEWADLATTDQEGVFTMPSVPGPGQCLLWPRDEDLHLPVVIGQTALPDATPVVFVLDAAAPTRGRLRVHPTLPSGAAAQVEARVLQVESGRVAQMSPLGIDNALEIGGLCAGAYRVEVGADTLGWLACGPVQVDGRGVWNIGNVQLPSPGRVRLRLPDGIPSLDEFEHGFYRRTADVDVLAVTLRRSDGTLQMPVGDYVLIWRVREQQHAVALQVRSDSVTELNLRRR